MTPSAAALAPGGGVEQSTGTALVGIAQDWPPAFEPAFADGLVAVT